MLGCARPVVPAPTAVEVHRPELWVDAFSAPGGDGSRERPLRVVPSPIPDGVHLHLRSGLYAGPFSLGNGTQLEGHGEVVLTGGAGEVVLSASDATLVGLSLQGGDVGLLAGKNVKATRVRLSGQRRLAARVVGDLSLEGVTAVASVEGIDGLQVDRGGALSVKGGVFSGGFRRAVTTEGGRLSLTQLEGEGVKSLVHAIDAELQLTTASAIAGVGPALFIAGGHAQLTKLSVRGHEFGLQLAREADVTVDGLVVSGTAQACVSEVNAKLTLRRAELSACGLSGAVMLLGGATKLSQLTVGNTREVGVLLRQGALSLEDSTFSFISASGDALGDAVHVRDAVARLDRVRVTDVDGSALFASALAEVTGGSLEVERSHQAALFVERGSQVTLESLLVRGGFGPSVIVPDAAKVTLGTLSVAGGNDLPVYAECQAGARVALGRLESTVQQLTSACITRGR